MKEKLFTNKDEQKLLEEINNEILTSNEVYLIYPFISKSVLNKIASTFEFCAKNNIQIKIISTTFDDLAQYNNLNELKLLADKYSNIKIKIEDNLERTSERIHIKASIFKRNNELSTVIIGSSNLTVKGMISGREWNIKLSEQNNKELINKMINEFDSLWNEEFVDFSDEFQRELLIQKIKENQQAVVQSKIELLSNNLTKKYLYKFQKEIIDKLSYRRHINKNKNLVIMATGTGKTLVSAFDYKRQTEQAKKDLKILFLAHQREIVDQAIKTYRHVLENNEFGEVMYDGSINSDKPNHLFATIQTLSTRLDKFEPDDFDIIVYDEAHHIAANTFDKVFNYFKPQQILGLTATPEREDNKDIKAYFDDEYATELRLWDAIDQKLLCPFDYYCIDDTNTNLQGVDLNSDKDIFKVVNTESRNELLFETIKKYLGVYARPTALIFCVTVEHAINISNYLKSKNLKAEALTSQNTKDRKRILHEFSTGRINYLCVVNIFNEGVDIPEINTIILLRPTNSKTVYLQQLGRGLRKTELKNKLEVYDLISNIDNKYDITLGIRNLFNPAIRSSKSISAKEGLPYNCTINLEKHTEEIIINSMKSWYLNKNSMKSYIVEYYERFKEKALNNMLKDYDLTLIDFYNNLDNLFMPIAKQINKFKDNENNTNRNKNILKQFLFLNNHKIINYFYKRLTKQLPSNEINLDLDNLLITSCLYEITSMEKFLNVYPNYLEINDLVENFIDEHKVIVEELVMILKYKLDNETLIFENEYETGLNVSSTYTVKQVLSLVNRTNFLHYRTEMKVLTFQAGFLTFDNSKQIILADEESENYGKKTKHDDINNLFYWSLPEKMTIKNKIIKDFENENIKKYLFIQDRQNVKKKNLYLKLYKFTGIGKFEEMLFDDFLTAKFKLK
ncbi:DEAD/DEAH family helicase [Mesoplasma entomophilum]|uniref:DNA/RNA helicase n=1 Tax=Mesoplasma entomophilum TaxID=2149 RepID=A0A3S5XZY8_9MOLU|nr:DEAD/DEAH box helicase family protein [Mesoplasma entomophilum]ATQ35479.1 DNA/RNA helicase [Mesoplasma entomophilum]ATZ19439.1 DEAD/DEAH family helicase [Mesoplasma entomophilum]